MKNEKLSFDSEWTRKEEWEVDENVHEPSVPLIINSVFCFSFGNCTGGRKSPRPFI